MVVCECCKRELSDIESLNGNTICVRCEDILYEALMERIWEKEEDIDKE